MTITKTILALGASMFIASPALALDAEKSATVSANPEKAWEAVGDFCAIADWHPAVESCALSEAESAARRTLALAGGGTIVEELISRDDTNTTYTYKIVESPLPIANYESTISVAAVDGGARVTWVGTFDASGVSDEEAQAIIEGIYDAGLQGIVQKANAN